MGSVSAIKHCKDFIRFGFSFWQDCHKKWQILKFQHYFRLYENPKERKGNLSNQNLQYFNNMGMGTEI